MLDAEGFMEYKNRAYAASGKALIDDFATSEKREQILTFLGKKRRTIRYGLVEREHP